MNKVIPFFCLLLCLGTKIVFAQELQPTETLALLNVCVTDFAGKARPGEIIVFKGKTQGKSYQNVTDSKGSFQLLLPEGDVYQIQYKNFSDHIDYQTIEIPVAEGMISSEVQIKIEPPKTYTLRNVLFDTGKASLKSSSYATLNDLVEVLKMKPLMKIEIAGHTDNVGEVNTNLKLSQERAESVRKYLISRGVESVRVLAKGYGESQPVADNGSEVGRKRNRRTEVRILSE